MPFIQSTNQNNERFQRGWNMIMSMYGQKQIAERAETQQKHFDQQMGQQQKSFGLRERRFAEDAGRGLEIAGVYSYCRGEASFFKDAGE